MNRLRRLAAPDRGDMMAQYVRRKRPGIMFYHDELSYMPVLEAEEVKRIICFMGAASQALVDGETLPELPDLSGAAGITCQNMLAKLLRDNAKYQTTCEKRSNAKGDLSRLKVEEVDSGTLTERNVTVTEHNVAVAESTGDNHDILAEIQSAAQGIGLPFAPADRAMVEGLIREYSAEWVLHAIQRTQERKRNWGTVKGILNSWQEKGGIDDARNQQGGGYGGTERKYDLSDRYM